MKQCSVEGCHKPLLAKGFCGAHYAIARKHGKPIASLAVEDFADGRKQIPVAPLYAVRQDGAIFRMGGACGAKPGQQIKHRHSVHGYSVVGLRVDRKVKMFSVHRLVAMTFLGSIPPKMDVCHIDGNKQNNNLSNLRIDTRKGNMADQIAFGKTPRGEKSGSNKYSQEFVLSIRGRLDDGESVSLIHKETGIPKPTLYGIKSRQTWFWL